VRRIISKAILFFEERARSRMLDEQRNEWRVKKKTQKGVYPQND
jgi:hypothetical protein